MPTQRSFSLGVIPLMQHEVGFFAEALPALIAVVRFLPRVSSFVGNEARALAEALSTQKALVGFLPGVDPHVLNQGGVVAEALAAA